jgi:hypothetical protein
MARYERPAEDVARPPSAREARRRPVAGSASPLTAAPPSPDAMGPDAIARLQRSAGNAGVAAYLEGSAATPPDAALAEPGRSLDAGLRGEMESALGADFSSVRVHEGGTAAESAHALGARAYTVGEDIVVGSGGSDRRTMAHELTHVVQQRAGRVDGVPTGLGYTVSDPGDPFERAASQTAAAIVAGGSAAPGSAGPGAAPGSSAQRAEEEPEEVQPVQAAPEDEEELAERPEASMADGVSTAGDVPEAGIASPEESAPASEAPQMITVMSVWNRRGAPAQQGDSIPTAPAGAGSAPTAPTNGTAGPAAAPGGSAPSAAQQSDTAGPTSSPPRPVPSADASSSAAGGGTQSAVIGALWTSMVLTPIRSAVTATAGDKPDYKSAAGALRSAKEAVITVMASLPDGDPRIKGIATLLTELDIYIEVTANRAHEPGDQPANVATIIGSVADDAVGFGSALGESGPGGRGAILSALWTSGAVTPIRAAAAAAAGDKPDYATAAAGLRRARETLLTVLTSLPQGDPRISQVAALLDELDLYIEVTSDRAHIAGDQPADVSKTVDALADDAAKLGGALMAP